MIFFLFKILALITFVFIVINFSLFIWRIMTPYGRMYYRNVYGQKSYFGYVRKSSTGEFVITDAGRMVGDKKIGVITTENNKSIIKLKQKNLSDGNYYYKDLGYVNPDGDIFNQNDELIAQCDPFGVRDWRYFWLMHKTEVYFVAQDNNQDDNKINTGHCTESLRFGYRKTSSMPLLAKAAAALVLCENYIVAEEENRVVTNTSYKDLAFPASITYTALFVIISPIMIYYNMFPVIGEMLSYVFGMLVVYFLIWWTLYMIKTDFANRNISFGAMLNLINRNTGINSWNFWLIFFSVLGLISSVFIHGYIYMPLFIVLLIGTIVNKVTFTAAGWKINEPNTIILKPKKKDSNRNKIKLISPTQPQTQQDKTEVKNSYSIDLNKFGIDNASKNVEVSFYKEDFEDEKTGIRLNNPFYGKDDEGNEKWKDAMKNLESNAKIVLKGLESDEIKEEDALDVIINSISDLCQDYNLSDFEMLELILEFCQKQIKYKLDEESEPIGKADEYLRFSIETLFDKEGDCDCKAILAYKFFERLNIDVKFAIVSFNDDKPSKHAGVLIKKDTGTFRLSPKFKISIPNYPDYAYCEVSSEGWVIGAIPHDIVLDDIKTISA
jgi:hypothetical protein